MDKSPVSLKRILLSGPISQNQVTGLTLAFQLLVKELESRNYKLRIVNTIQNNRVSKSGNFSILRSIETLYVIFLVIVKLNVVETYYATMSTSKFGFVRDLLSVSIAKLLRKKVILHLHGGGFEEFYQNSSKVLKCLIRFNLKNTDKIIVLGELLKEQFYCVGPFVKKKLVVVPNGLTLGVAEPERHVKSFKKGESIRLLYLSSLMPSKGYVEVIRALEELNEEDTSKQYHLDLCGSFVDAITEESSELSNEQELLEYIQVNGLSECIHYHGLVTGRQKEKLLEKAHIFLLPTYYPWEGQPLSIIEAMAYGTPVISCQHKGIPEMLEDGTNGFFVQPQNARDIADKCLKLCSEVSFYESLSMNARKKYEKQFTRSVHLENLISEILTV
jgi:glycosyltransferase involved in cell wall biosynthesis